MFSGEPVKLRTLFISAFISIVLLYVACVQSPEKAPVKPGGTAPKQSVDQKKTVRVKHLSGEVLAVNARTKTVTVRFKDEDVYLTFDDSTVVKIDLDSVKPSEIPLGARATVKYIERKGQHIAKGIFISTETAEKKEGSPQSFFRNSAKHDAPRSKSPLPCSA
jgi:hypothetical protein